MASEQHERHTLPHHALAMHAIIDTVERRVTDPHFPLDEQHEPVAKQLLSELIAATNFGAVGHTSDIHPAVLPLCELVATTYFRSVNTLDIDRLRRALERTLAIIEKPGESYGQEEAPEFQRFYRALRANISRPAVT